jgi:hypothetical protein
MEQELRDALIPHLEQAASGENDLVFCVSDFNPFHELRFTTDSKTEQLVLLGRKILGLREKLDEPTAGTIAERICWYCRRWGDTSNHQRKAAQGLAKAFLDEVLYAET